MKAHLRLRADTYRRMLRCGGVCVAWAPKGCQVAQLLRL